MKKEIIQILITYIVKKTATHRLPRHLKDRTRPKASGSRGDMIARSCSRQQKNPPGVQAPHSPL